MSNVSDNGYELLWGQLDADKYELLRLKLTSCATWKGCPDSQADSLADIVFDRIANKLGEGEKIGNLTAYACTVLNFVWLEYSRKRKEDTVGGEDFPEIVVAPDVPILEDPDVRKNCLRVCMNEVVPDDPDRSIIIGYYDPDAGKKNKDHRKKLAARFGLTMNTLKVKACRIRARLEKCINECVDKVAVSQTA